MKLKLNYDELLIVRDVLDVPSQKGSSIKDIKLIEKIIDLINSVIPVFKSFEQVENETSEELEARKVAYNKEIEEIKKIEQEVELQPLEVIVLKSRFSSVNNFLDGNASRKNLVALAEKLGL